MPFILIILLIYYKHKYLKPIGGDMGIFGWIIWGGLAVIIVIWLARAVSNKK